MRISPDMPGFGSKTRDLRFIIDGCDLTDTMCIRGCDDEEGWVEMYIPDPRHATAPESGKAKLVRYVLNEDKTGGATYRLYGKVEIVGDIAQFLAAQETD